MAYIKIPTGIHEITATVSRKSYIQYQCYKCGNKDLYEYILSQEGSGNYHVFQSTLAKQNVENNAKLKAMQLLDQQDAALFYTINLEHNYELITKKIQCPCCGEKQPWSKIPVSWKKSKLFMFWLIGLFLLFMFTCAFAYAIELKIAAVFAVLTALMAVPPLIHYIRRKNTLRDIQNLTFVPPVYYNKQNIQELIEQLNPNFSKENEANSSSQKLLCPNCGAEIYNKNNFCDKCGFKLH